MNLVPDPLVHRTVPERLRFSTGELLDADDFVAEQTYHRRQLARSMQFLYGSGTIAGLRVTTEHRPGADGAPDEVELVVEPGIALDRAGRMIEVPREACLRLRRWFEYGAGPGSAGDRSLNPDVLRRAWRDAGGAGGGGAVVADVFLAFHPCPRGYTPAFASGPFDALDASRPSRVRDAYELTLVPRPEPDEDLPAAFDPWAAIVGNDTDERLAAAREASLQAWQTMGLPPPGHVGEWHENPVGVDPTAILLARLRLPAAQAPDAASAPMPDWSDAAWPDAAARLDNTVRNFILTPAAVLRVVRP
jgi:hypothetical protein